jgi:hypothetical protein
MYDTPDAIQGHDLVWTGSGYGVFYASSADGIFFLRLDEDGKPVSDPLLVVDDPLAREPAADLTTGGYVLVWVTGGDDPVGMSFCSGGGPNIAKIRLLDFLGASDGLAGPYTFLDTAGGPPDVATGEGGFGLTMMDYTGIPGDNCRYRFVHVNSELSEAVYSGYLGIGQGVEVDYVEDAYVTSMASCRSIEDETSICNLLCVARYFPSGELGAPPVCNAIDTDTPLGHPPRLAHGDGGLSLLFGRAGTEGRWLRSFLRTDMAGVATGSHEDLTSDILVDPYNIAAADFGFGALLSIHDYLYFVRLVPEE